MDLRKAEPLSFLDRLSIFFATGLCVSYLPTLVLAYFRHRRQSQTLTEKKWTGAGMLGSIEGVVTFLVLPANLAHSWLAMALGLIFAVVVSGRAEKALGSHDDARIVLDEWIGAWIAVAATHQGWGGLSLLLPFVLFRVFDVLKGPIGRRLQYLPGGWGVVMDDVYAGLFAHLLTRLSVGLFGLSL